MSTALVLAGLVLGASASLHAETYVTYPNLGKFKIAGPVQFAKSDAASKAFFNNELSSMSHLVKGQENLPKSSSGYSWEKLRDSAQLTLSVAKDVRAYFVGEDTKYHNSLGYNIKGTGVNPDDALVIFPDASTTVSWNNATKPRERDKRTDHNPLFPGDFVDLGRIDKGKTLDFFLIANGRGEELEGTPNVLGAKNMVAFTQVDNPYLLIGFEDGTGTFDYTDAVFALDIGVENIQGILHPSGGVPAPEPGLISLVVIGIGGVLQLLRRRRSRG